MKQIEKQLDKKENSMSNCMKCGKELQVGDRVIWRCEDCARKQMEEYDNKDQRITELEEQLKEKDLAIDKFLKIDIWLIRKYGKKLYKDFNITNDDTDIKNFIKISQVFDNIYEEMNKEMPLMWFNYGFVGLPKLDKGE